MTDQRFAAYLIIIITSVFMMSNIIGRGNSQETRRYSCIEKERQALLRLKEKLNDDELQSSWTSTNQDCCSWKRIRCDNQTNHVIFLSLRPIFHYSSDGSTHWTSVANQDDPTDLLLDLPYLQHLDLSGNTFTTIPTFIGSLTHLTYLNFSRNPLSGIVPLELGNLKRLKILHISSSNYTSDLIVHNFEWLSHLSSLTTLKLENVKFKNSSNWLHYIKIAPSLSTLELRSCHFPMMILDLKTSNSTSSSSSNSLKHLYMNQNTIHRAAIPQLLNVSSNLVNLTLSSNNGMALGPLPDNSFEKMRLLAYIDLSQNGVEGGMPKSSGNLCNLKTLILSGNGFGGKLHNLLKNLTFGCTKNSLEILDLKRNKLQGSFPDFRIFQSLSELYLDDNQLEGPMPNSLSQLQNLVVLSSSRNKLTGSLPDVSHLSSLRVLRLANNKLNGTLRENIGQLSNLEVIDVSSNSFTGVVSQIHLQNLSKLYLLDLSFNSLTLNLTSSWVPTKQLAIIKLSSCKLGTPQFPGWLQNHFNFFHLDISSTGISDTIPDWFYSLNNSLRYLNLSSNNIRGTLKDFPIKSDEASPTIDLSFNQLHGSIPISFSNASELILSNNLFSTNLEHFLCSKTEKYSTTLLDISNNMFSGKIPNCWNKWEKLQILNLEKNNFSGTIPASLGSLDDLQVLTLKHNNLTGNLPSSIQSCTILRILDIGNNKLNGTVPTWIGRILRDLIVLSLTSNRLHGAIPSEICQLSSMQTLDLSLNNISGVIPPCIHNWTLMVEERSSTDTLIILGTGRDAAAFNSEYSYAIHYDYLEGDYDVTVYKHKASIMWKGNQQIYHDKNLGLLRSVDLSSNKLTGHIPKELVDLVQLNQLNLSRNELSGHIPQNIGRLNKLESLDLSHNQLSGEIPNSLGVLNFLAVLDLSNNQLSGKIPTGPQLQTLGSYAYEENLGLCGPPLTSRCQTEDETPIQGPHSRIDDEESWIDLSSFRIGSLIGFILSFWCVCGTFFLLNPSRRFVCLF